MRGRPLTACMAGLAILVLGGCMRQSAYYYIQPDDTVDGTIYVALDEAYVDASDAYRGTGADDVAAFFAHSTITPFDNGKWKGYHVAFEDEPLATFAGVTDETWGVQIVKVSNQYVIHGYAPTSSDDSLRQAIIDDDGFMQLTVSFPGTLVEQTESDQMSGATVKPGWASWDMTTVTAAPYAKGNGGFLYSLVPGFAHLFLPSGDPDPHPSASVVAPPAPEPVVTVVITPSPVESASPSPSPTPSVIAAPESDSSSGIPVWVWVVGAVLLAALAGLGGVLFATLKNQKATPPPATSPEEPAAEPPAAKASETPKAKPKAPKTGDEAPAE